MLDALHRAIWGRWSLWPIEWLAEWRRLLVVCVGAVVILVSAIQLVPYGRDHVNPVVLGEPGWDFPRTEELARRACFDYHSNEMVWPWYSNVVSVSVVTDASYWGDEEVRTVSGGSMPPWDYFLAHPTRG
jgi:hypothetical protein